MNARPTAREQAKIPVLTARTLSLKVFMISASFAQFGLEADSKDFFETVEEN